MTTETLEGNKLIAEFDGWEISQDQEQIYLHSGSNKVLNRLIGFDDCVYLDDAHYHSSWDWQIPAFGKVALAVKTLIPKLPNPENIGRWYFRNLDKYEKAIFNNEPLEGQKIIVEFIKWYNEAKIKELQTANK